MNYERTTYRKIKSLIFDAYYDFCRERGVGMGWPHEQVLASVAYEYENVFELPVENLMLRTILLILSGAWYKEGESNARKWVEELLEKDSFAQLVKEIPAEEAEELYRDMKGVKLI